MAVSPAWPTIQSEACLDAPAAVAALRSSTGGLTEAEAAARLAELGPNAIRTHGVRVMALLWSQVRSPLLLLLAVTALVSAFVGEGADAAIIGVILVASVGLGFVNEYRAARTAQALHDQMRHRVTVRRDGRPYELDVTELVPGDIVELEAGEIVPADVRLLAVEALECDESVLTGESSPVEKAVAPVPADAALGDLTCCALMGTLVRAGRCTGVVVGTGARTEFGRIAVELGEREPETQFQQGLRSFSMLLVVVAAVLTTAIFVVNVALHRPIIDAVLFSLAIAVGISPQLLPAVVATSLSAGSRALARQKVLVKRLVCIEDLGDIEVLFTDKTGTLTEGRLDFMRAIGPDALEAREPLLLGLVASGVIVQDDRPIGGNALDRALWQSPAAVEPGVEAHAWHVLGEQPFDHASRTSSVVAVDPHGVQRLVVKGAPESVLPRCPTPAAELTTRLDHEFAAGNRVVAVATARLGPGTPDPSTLAASGLELAGLLVFLDPPRPDAAPAISRLASLGVAVRVITGDNATVADHVCDELGLPPGAVLTGGEIDGMSDASLTEHIPSTRVFARVSPEQKARVIRLHRGTGTSVAFLGDGVNDTLALHAADVGISVDSATDVAKDAADVILLEKNLDVLATGVVGGRRVFANTIKYVLMGTSSNFGNMFSAAGASLFLPFLPMLPSQILLNNLLYDSSQLAIPTDSVDPDQLQRPSHWDIGMIRRFMLFFGPISSAFDFITFGILLWALQATPVEFRTGWFVESLATQTLVIFAIRTRRTPFFRSRPSRALLIAACAVVLVGAWLPASPLSGLLGFTPLPLAFYGVLVVLVICYLAIVDFAKGWFFAHLAAPGPSRPPASARRLHRRASRFGTSRPLTH